MFSKLLQIDNLIARSMKAGSLSAIRISFAVIFVWFGILKPLGLSAAAPLVLATVSWLPFFTLETWLSIIGWWEVVIGLSFLHHKTTKIGIGLLFLQMGGTFLPLFMLPAITFQQSTPWLPTMEGQYIIKNLMIISAALVIGGSTYRRQSSKNA